MEKSLNEDTYEKLTIASLAGVLETLYLTAIFCALIESPGTSLKRRGFSK